MGETEPKILDLIDFKKIDALLEGFNKSTGFVSALLDLDGNILSKSGWRTVCTDFHRINPKSALLCTYSDTHLSGIVAKDQKYHHYKCLNGLVDVAVPIVVHGKHIANLFSGQFFFEKPDIDYFKKQAKECGFNEKEYLQAVRDVPIVDREKVRITMDFLMNMTQLISETAAQKLEAEHLSNTIIENEQLYRTILSNIPDGLIHILDRNMVFTFLAGEEATKLGIKNEAVIGKQLFEVIPKDNVALLNEQFNRVITGETVHYESLIGNEVYSIISAPLRKTDGEIDRILTLAINITGQKKAESTIGEQLEELKRWYDAMLEREERIIEMKKEVNILLERCGEPHRYTF